MWLLGEYFGGRRAQPLTNVPEVVANRLLGTSYVPRPDSREDFGVLSPGYQGVQAQLGQICP